MADPNVATSLSSKRKRGGASRARPMRRPTKAELAGIEQRSRAKGLKPTKATILATWRRSNPVTAPAKALAKSKPGSGAAATTGSALQNYTAAAGRRRSAPATPAAAAPRAGGVKTRPTIPLPPGLAKKAAGVQSARAYAPGQAVGKPKPPAPPSIGGQGVKTRPVIGPFAGGSFSGGPGGIASGLLGRLQPLKKRGARG